MSTALESKKINAIHNRAVLRNLIGLKLPQAHVRSLVYEKNVFWCRVSEN